MEKLAAIPGLKDIGLTTNGILLAPMARALRDAGLERINISLDTMDAAKFERLTRRPGFEQVIEGILAAKEAGFRSGENQCHRHARRDRRRCRSAGPVCPDHGLELRFIEYMPLDAGHLWEREKVLFAADILDLLDRGIGPLVPTADQDPRAPALDYEYADGGGRGGLYRLDQPALLPELQPDPAYVRRQAAQLPVLARRDRCSAAPCAAERADAEIAQAIRDCVSLKVGRTRNQYGPVHPARAFDALDRRVNAVLVGIQSPSRFRVASITRSPRICSLGEIGRRAVHKSWLYSSLELERVASNRLGPLEYGDSRSTVPRRIGIDHE